MAQVLKFDVVVTLDSVSFFYTCCSSPKLTQSTFWHLLMQFVIWRQFTFLHLRHSNFIINSVWDFTFPMLVLHQMYFLHLPLRSYTRLSPYRCWSLYL